MVVMRHPIEGYDNFIETVEYLKDKNNVYVMFTGSKETSGFSWCPDCVEAEPVIEEVLRKCKKVTFIYVGVGTREVWKDPENKFRKDEKIRLACVPTLMKWSTGDRLNDKECKNKDLVELLFEDHISEETSEQPSEEPSEG